MSAAPVSLALESGETISGLWQAPAKAKAALVLAHGAGAGMSHKAMAAIADGLAARSVATLRYNFLYMERGGGRTDAPPVAHAAVRAAVKEAARLAPKLPLFAGGRSFGGRMTSQAQALAPLANVRGLIFFAFPLHNASKPADGRAAHLADVNVPMLFLTGTRDELATLDLLRPVVKKLGKRARLTLIEDGDHSFHVRKKITGKSDADVLDEALDEAAAWIAALL